MNGQPPSPPQAPGPPQPPGLPPSRAPRSKRKTLWIVIGVIVGLVIIGAIISSVSKKEKKAETPQKGSTVETTEPVTTPAPAEQPTATAKIGQAVRDGKFEFTVNAFERGVPTLGENELLRKDAQGQFCVMDVTVKNIGDKAQTFFSSNQKVKDAQGKEYSNDEMAEIAVNVNNVWLNEINPGNTMTGKVVFDVPKDADIVTAELHDSAFSNGVEVSLK